MPNETKGENDEIKSLRAVCGLCEASVAYRLTSENWFQLGLIHSHRKLYSQLLEEVGQFLPMNTNGDFLIAFNADQICLASAHILTEEISVMDLMQELVDFDYARLSDNIFNFTLDAVKPTFFMLRYLTRN